LNSFAKSVHGDLDNRPVSHELPFPRAAAKPFAGQASDEVGSITSLTSRNAVRLEAPDLGVIANHLFVGRDKNTVNIIARRARELRRRGFFAIAS
jgi:hypothetical protein